MLCVSDYIAIPFSRRKALRLYEFDRENKSIYVYLSPEANQ